MSKVEILRVFVNQRLTAAAEEIFELFERTITEYEEQLEFSSKENQRQQKLLDAVLNPEVQIHRADVPQLLVVKEDGPPAQQEWSLSMYQEDQELPHIKEEEEELWTSQEGEQLQGLEEADTKFPFTYVHVKTEEDEETAQSAQLQRQTENREEDHLKTEADGEDCEGPESAWISDPDSLLQPATHNETSPSSESETDDDREWEEANEPQSGSNLMQNNEIPVSDMEYNTGETSVSSSECARSFGHKGHQQKRTGIQSGEKPFSGTALSASLISQARDHSDGKTFSCSVCKTDFSCSTHLVRHMRGHTGEKPFSCSYCGKRFKLKYSLKQHLPVHTGEKPFSCSVCGRKFAHKGDMRRHLAVHTGEKPFSCSICGKSFAQKEHLKRHLLVHTGEKPFACSICDKRFTLLHNAKKHKCIGESSSNK